MMGFSNGLLVSDGGITFLRFPVETASISLSDRYLSSVGFSPKSQYQTFYSSDDARDRINRNLLFVGRGTIGNGRGMLVPGPAKPAALSAVVVTSIGACVLV